jgi:hypothetical protein
MPPLAFLVGHSSFPAIFTADSLLSSLSVIGQSSAAEVMTSRHVMGGNTGMVVSG